MNSKILAATAAITAGVIISSAFMINNNKSNDIYSQIVTQDSTMKDFKASDIIVGMIPEADKSSPLSQGDVSIFLIPPTTDYKTAYMSAIALFENDNPAAARDFRNYHCVYADGRIDFKNVVYSEKVTAGVADAKKISKHKVYGESSEDVYLNVNKKFFNGIPGADMAFKNSGTQLGISNTYMFNVYKLDGTLEGHSNNKEILKLNNKFKVDMNIKTCLFGEKKLEGLEKVYDLKSLNADIFDPEEDVLVRNEKVPKYINGTWVFKNK